MSAQDIGGAQSAAALAANSMRTRRFWNWKLMAFELAIALLGFSVFHATTARKPIAPGIVGVLAGVAALWMFLRELAGVSINSEAIRMPACRIPWFPVLSFWRRTVLLTDVRRLTVSPPWSGFEMLRISGDFGSDVLVFSSKGQRRRFVMLVESLCPAVSVYRSRSLPS